MSVKTLLPVAMPDMGEAWHEEHIEAALREIHYWSALAQDPDSSEEQASVAAAFVTMIRGMMKLANVRIH